jgi:predicted transcriptional regulator
MTTATATEQDLDHLMALLDELHAAGRIEEGRSVARAYAALSAEVYPELLELPDDDPELVEMLEEADRDIAAGRLIPHEEVLPHLRALIDASG